MEHVVFFPAPDGSPAFRRVPSLDEAVRLVEHLRNVEGVNDVSCHALTEVPMAFRAYYRVEVGATEVGDVGSPAEQHPVSEAPPAPVVHEVEQVEQQPVSVSANGHRVAGANSLGFFA